MTPAIGSCASDIRIAEARRGSQRAHRVDSRAGGASTSKFVAFVGKPRRLIGGITKIILLITRTPARCAHAGTVTLHVATTQIPYMVIIGHTLQRAYRRAEHPPTNYHRPNLGLNNRQYFSLRRRALRRPGYCKMAI